MTTPIWLTGFEYGQTTLSVNGGGLCDVITGACAVRSAQKHTGNYSLQCTSSAAAFAFISRTISGTPNILVGRFYFGMFNTLPSADVIIFSMTTTGAHKVQFGIDITNMKLYPAVDDVLYVNDTYNDLVLGLWYRVDFKIDMSANPWTIDWEIDGAVQAQETYVHAADTFTNVDVGINTMTGLIMYYDDVIISTTAGDFPIGDGGTFGLKPNADGTHNNAANIMEDQAGHDIDGITYYAYSLLNELPWVAGVGTYVRQWGVGTDKYVEVQFEDIATHLTYSGVSALLEYASSATTANTGGCIIRDSDGTETTVWGAPGALADYSETTVQYKHVIVTVPAGGWTEAYINSLRARMGYSDNVASKPYWVALMLEVAFEIPADSSLQTNHSVAVESIDDVTNQRMTNMSVNVEDIDDVTEQRVTNFAIMVEWTPPGGLAYDVTQVI